MLTDKDWAKSPLTREELGWGELPKPQTDEPSNVTYTNSKGEVIDDIEEYIKPPLTAGEFAGKMIGAGVDQVQGLGYGALGLAGDLAEVEGVKNWGLEGFNENMRAAALANKEAGMGEFSDIEDVGDAAKWAYGTFLQQVPQLLPTLALGGAGGIAGKQLAKGFITNAVQKGIATGLTEEAAAAAVANAVASRGGMKWAARRLMEGGFTREAAEGSLGQIAKAQMAPVAGVAAGNIATGIGMEAGSIYGETEDAGLALQYGIPAGMIEGLTDSIIGAPFVRRAFGVNAVKSVAKEEASLLKDLGKGVAKGLAVEGPLEELPQTYLEQLANLEKDPNHYGPGGIDSERAKRERMNAMAAGSLMGSAIGGASGLVEHAPMTARAVMQKFTDPETGKTDFTETDPAEEKIPSGELLFDNDSVDIDGVTMRRWNIEKTGDSGWAVENAPQETLDKLAAAKSGVVSNGKLLIFPNNEEGATLIDRAETARAKALGEIDDKDGDGIPDKEQDQLTKLDLSTNESVIQAANQRATKKAVVEAGIPSDAADELIKDLRDSGIEEDRIVEVAKATAATLPTDYLPTQTLGAEYGKESELYDVFKDVRRSALPASNNPVTKEPVDPFATLAETDASGDLVEDFKLKPLPVAEAVAEAATPTATKPKIQITNIDSIINQGGGTVAVQEGDRDVNFKQFGIAIDGDTAEVAFVEIDPSEYGKGIGLEAYRSLGNELSSRGITLKSSGAQYGPGRNLWLKLAQQGNARLIGQGKFEFVAQPAAEVAVAEAATPTTTIEEEVEDQEDLEEPAPSPVEVKLQEMQAAHDKSETAKKAERQKLLDSRTLEQDHDFVRGLKVGDRITNGVTSGTFVKRTRDGGVVVATKDGEKKIAQSTVSNTTYDNSSPAPTRDEALVNLLRGDRDPFATQAEVDASGDVVEDFKLKRVNLEAAGLKVTGDVDEDGVEILENPRKDLIVKGSPFKVFTQLFTNAAGEIVPRSWHEYAPNTATTATRKTAKRNILRAMDQGVEVRIPNSVEVPAGVSVVPVEGKNYSVVDAVDYEEDGVNIGTYTAADLAERQGTFKDDYNGSQGLNDIRLQRSIANNQAREANETSADASAANAASNLPPAAQAIFSLFNGTWLQSIQSYLASDKMSGVGPDGIEHFNKTAANKFIKALSTAFGKEDGDAGLVKKTAELFISGEKLSKIAGLALEGRAQNKKETALVNRTIKKLDGAFKFFVLPQKHATPLGQVASAAFTFDKLRRKLSLDAKNEGGESLGDSLSQDGGKAKGVSLSEASAPYNVQQGEEDAETTQDSVSRGELTDEEKEKVAQQNKRTSEITSSQGIEEALATLADSLSDTERLAYDYISTPEKNLSAVIYRKLEEKLELLGDETSPDEVIADVRSQIAEVAQRVAGKEIILSPAATAGAAAPVGLNGGKVERKKSSPQVQRIKRRFLQVKGGLSDDQMVSMEDAEVDRAYLSYTAKADETRAASAQDAVVSVSPGIERLVSLDSKSLVGEYADAITAAEAGDSSDLRDLNFKELVRMGAYHSTKEFLTRIADPKNGASRDMQIRAKAFLGLEKRGMNLANIEAQAASFTKAGTKERAAWGGLLGRNADSTAFGIYLNLDQAHDRATPVQTFLHELAHVTTIAKINGAVKTTAEEDRIIKDLERMRRAAVIKAGDASPVIKAAADAAGVSTPEQRYESYIKTFSKLIAQGAEGSRKYNGLQNLNEFVVEMTGSPDFVKLLSQLGFGTANPEKRAFTGLIRDAFNSILKLIAGNISPSSEIGKAFSDSWKLTYSGSKYKVEPSALLESVRGVVAEEKAKEETKAKPKAEPKAKVEKATEPTVKESLPVETPEGNNPATEKKPEGPKRGRGRPKVPRVQTELPTKEAFEKEMAQGEMTPEERAAEFAKEKAPQSPAGTRKTPASPFAAGEREMAEVRSTNHSDVLFYAGINEEAFYSAVGKGDFTTEELERGAVRNVSTMLNNIAGDESLSAPLRHVAQMLLDLGHDFSGVKFRVAREGDTDWAGLYTIGKNASSGEIAINVDASHRGGVAQTLVHEALHHVSFFKLKPGYQLNKVERAAVRDLEKLRKHAERVYRGKNLAEGKSSSSRASTNEGYYGLTNIDEFLTEILSDENFQAFLVGIKPMNGIAKKGGLIRNLLDQVFSYLKDFVFGTDVSGDSLLTQGLDNVMTLIQTPQDDLMVQAMASVMDERKSMPSAPRDTEYLAAVESGDMETAQQMVDEAAKKAGYGQFGVHRSTKSGITEFKKEGVGKDPSFSGDAGFYFAFSEDDPSTRVFGNRTYRVYLKTNNPAPVNVLFGDRARVVVPENVTEAVQKFFKELKFLRKFSKLQRGKELGLAQAAKEAFEVAKNKRIDPERIFKADAQRLINLGYDSIIWKGDPKVVSPPQIVVLTPNQIKSADPVTYDEGGKVIPLSQRFDETSPLIVMSPAGDMATKVLKLTGAEEHTTFNNGIYKTGGWLSADGKLDQRAGDKWRDSRHKIAATTRRIDTLSSRLVKAVKASKGATTALMNTALGNLDNPLTQKQREEVKQMRVSDESGANAMEAAFIAKNREAYKVKQRAALAALPKNVAEAISEMTEHISELSSTLKAAGFLDPKIAATVDANLGIYLHRSYQIFDDEKYAAEVRKNTKVMQAAEGLVKRQVESRNAAELIRQIEDEGGFISKADAAERTRGSAKKEDIDKAMDSLLSIGEEGMGAVILRGRIPGQKDLSVFDARGNIAPEIQALWGRYEDPTINYAKSVMKMATLTANHQFLSDIRSMGLKDGWLYEGPETDRPRGYLKISSDNNKSLAPLAGLHGNRLLVEALYEMFPQNGVSDNYAWVRAFSKATGWAMAAKTVLSPVAQVRNNLGNILFDVAAGNFGFSDISKIKGRASTAFNMSFKAAFNKFPEDAAFRKEMMSSLEDLVSRGVIGESLVGNILGDLMGAKKLSKSADEFSDRLMGGASRAASGVWNTAQRSYASSDDFWKVMGYLAEVDKYTKAMPGWTSEQVKDHAARIVRDIRPTYSLSPAVLAKVKAFPFVAPFITFTTEVIRTTINLTKLAHYEITEGERTGNAELKKIGWKRARGITLAATAPTAAAGVFTALAGISADDEDRLRRFLPDWQKNSQLLLFKNKDGKVSFADISYLDPYDYWKKAAGALFRALASSDDATATERITKGTMEAVGQLMRPFTSEQLVSGAIADVLRNTDSSGRQVFNPQDTGTNIAEKTVLHILKAFRPGALDVTSRIWSAAAGDVSDSGRAYNLGNEIAGLALGQRITEVNIEQALGFKASKFSRDDRDASAIFTKEFNSKGTRSTEQIADAYERANDAKYKLTSDFRDDLNAAIALGGISQKKAVEILKAYRVGQDDIQMIRSGRYKPYEPSDAAIKLAPKDRVKTAKAAAKLATSKPL